MHLAAFVGHRPQILLWLGGAEVRGRLFQARLTYLFFWSFILFPLLLAGSHGPGPVGGRPGDAIRLKNRRCLWAKIHRNREGFQT